MKDYCVLCPWQCFFCDILPNWCHGGHFVEVEVNQNLRILCLLKWNLNLSNNGLNVLRRSLRILSKLQTDHFILALEVLSQINLPIWKNTFPNLMKYTTRIWKIPLPKLQVDHFILLSQINLSIWKKHFHNHSKTLWKYGKYSCPSSQLILALEPLKLIFQFR